MAWFRIVDGRLHFRGITRRPFVAWSATAPGRTAMAAARSQVRFSLVGRDRAARSRLWHELGALVRDDRVQAIITEQACRYHTLLANFAFAEALPRTTVDLRRVVVVPRSLVNVRAHMILRERLAGLRLRGVGPAHEALQDFLVMTLVNEMDAAFAGSRPTARRPVPADEGWVSVGIDVAFVWVKPCWEGPAWEGHHYLYEQPRAGLSWRDRKDVERAIRLMRAALASRSRAERHETLQCAAAAVKA